MSACIAAVASRSRCHFTIDSSLSGVKESTTRSANSCFMRSFWPKTLMSCLNCTEHSIEEVFAREIEILSALAGVSSDDLEDLDVSEVSTMLKEITFINSEPSKNYKRDIDKWKFKPLAKLTCGEFLL